MAELKTRPTDKSVERFLRSVKDKTRRAECETLTKLMTSVTKKPGIMWGSSIVGFGSYHYKYKSGREGDWFLTGFSPRKQNLTVYIMCGFDRHAPIMKKLGKYKTGKSCLYINNLGDINLTALRELVRQSIRVGKK